jgi:serine/threonine-protein kinase
MLDSGRRLSIAQAVLVGLEAARALDYAHRRGLIHRDIKPANLCFDEEGRTAVADFGLARALAEAAWTEPDGVLLGTARYAAPEAAQGKSVDGKADIYALGWVLLEAVTGDPPPVGDTTVATLMARANQPIVAPFGLGALGPIIDAAGMVDPDDRPDAADFAVMLAEAARQLDAPAPLPVNTVLNLDARSPSVAADPTEMGTTTVLPVVGAVPPEPIKEVEGHKTRRRVSMVIGALVAVAALVAAGLYIPTILKPFHVVPSVEKASLADATAQLDALKYKTDTRHEYSESVPKDAVTRTDPKAGTKRREGSTIHIYVSEGRAPRKLPDVVGKSLDIAKALLEEAGFSLDPNVKHEFSETVEKDIVLKREPDGDKLPGGSLITLTISDGPSPRDINNWVGKPAADAKKGIEAAGLKYKEADGYSDSIAVGSVISTNPAAGAKVPKGGTVTVTVCRGTLTVNVPNVVGMNASKGIEALKAAGFTIGQVSGPRKKQQILFQDPGGDTKAPRGSAVNLYVN